MPKLSRRPQAFVPVYIGVDPGKTGGLVAIYPSMVVTSKMPATELDIWEWFSLDPEVKPVAVIERVHTGYPGSNKSAVAKLWGSYTALRMALIGQEIPFEDVTPRAWQKALGIPPRGKTESKTQWKNRLKAKAQQLFPKIKVTLDVADALLIAEYCRRNPPYPGNKGPKLGV